MVPQDYKEINYWFRRHIGKVLPENKYGKISIRFDTDNISFLAKEQSEKRLAKCDIHETTVISVCRIIKGILNGQNLAVLGLIQSDKTASQIVGTMLSCIIRYLKSNGKIKTYPLFLIPNGTSYLGQMNTKHGNTTAIFTEHCHVSFGGKEMSFREYFNVIESDVQASVENLRSKMMRNNDTKYPNSLFAEAAKISGGYAILALGRANRQVIELLINSLDEANIRLVICRDEAHHGVRKLSFNDKMFDGSNMTAISEWKNSLDITDADDQNNLIMYELLNKDIAEKKMQLVAVSATNWPGLHLDIVHVAIDNGYCGLDYGYVDENGQKRLVTDGVKIKPPQIESLNWLADAISCPILRDAKPSWYMSHLHFTKNAGKRGEHSYSDFTLYRKNIQKAIAKSILHVLDIDKSGERCGALVRFVNNNKELNSFVEKIQPLLPGIKIIQFYDEMACSVKELFLRHNLKPKEKYVIFVSAKARMSDSFPSHCAFGLDFTNKSGVMSTIIQGVLGRMCGYGKNPLIVLSVENYNEIIDYIKNGYCLLRHQKGSWSSGVGIRARRGMKFHVDDKKCSSDPAIWSIMNMLQHMVVDEAGTKKVLEAPHRKDGVQTIRLGHWFKKYDIFQNIFTEKRLQYLESKYLQDGERFCRPNDKNEEGQDEYMKDDEGRVLMVTRSEGNGFSRNVGGQTLQGEGQKVIIRVTDERWYGKSNIKLLGFDLMIKQGTVKNGNPEDTGVLSLVGK